MGRVKPSIAISDTLPGAQMAPVVDNLIVDVGVSDGRDAQFYLQKGFTVFGVEADPVQFKAVREFFFLTDPKQLTLLNRAAARKSGELMTIHRHRQHQGLSGAQKRLDVPDDYDTFDVPTIGWDEIISLVGIPRYLKVDVEGGELPFVEGIRDSGQFPEFISIEVFTADAIELLISMGYTRFVLVDQAPFQNNTYKLPARQIEGVRLDGFTFLHSSGPFGLDVFENSEWLTPASVVPAFELAKSNHWRTWYDCHAWRPVSE